MNKRLFVLICTIILFQYIYNDSACESIEAPKGDADCTADTADKKKSVCRYNPETKKCVDFPYCEYAEEGADDAACKEYPALQKGYECKKNKDKSPTSACKEVKLESTAGANNLKFSLAFLIFLFLF